MRVFVLGTGRCGTSTCYHAFSHATNYTAGHETNYWAAWGMQHDYPDDRIEVGHDMCPVAGLLLKRYPDAKFVHLQRMREECVDSMVETGLPMVAHFSLGNSVRDREVPPSRAMCELYYDAVNTNLLRMLPADRSKHLWLHEAAEKWFDIWEWTQCEGSFDNSLYEWSRVYNAAHTGSDVSRPLDDQQGELVRQMRKTFKILWSKAAGRGGYDVHEWEQVRDSLKKMGVNL